MSKPTLALDFDGCVHAYESPWTTAEHIADGPVPGAIDFIRKAVEHFRVCIFSSRCVGLLESRPMDLDGPRAVWAEPDYAAIAAMIEWLEKHGLARAHINELEFWAVKPPAHITIDDRALMFNGDWSAIDVRELVKFQPWNHHLRHP